MTDEAVKTAGQVAYEADCALCPNYDDGVQRVAWSALSDIARQSWERDPTPREWMVKRADRLASMWRKLPVTLSMGETTAHMTLGELIDANADSMGEADGASIARVLSNGVYQGGGGAAEPWTVSLRPMSARVEIGPGARFTFSPECIARMGGPIVEQRAQ